MFLEVPVKAFLLMEITNNDKLMIKANDGKIEFVAQTRSESRLQVRSSFPIPDNIRSFEFEFKIDNLGTERDISICLFSDITLFVYHGINGKVLLGENYVTTADRFENSDIISCILSRIIVDDVTYNLCYFQRNGKQIGFKRVVEGKKLWPGVFVNSPGAKLTYHDCAPLKYTKGKD